MNILITAGPTREYIDPVRFLSNPSSGKMGYALAQAATEAGHEVLLISGPTALEAPPNVQRINTISADDMHKQVMQHYRKYDIIIMCAAVCDYRPEQALNHKMKKQQQTLTLNLVPTVDILKQLGQDKGTRFLVGFAAETNDLLANAQAKLAAKNLDLIIANPVGQPDAGFQSDTNRISILAPDGTIEHMSNTKRKIGEQLIDRIIKRCENKT